MLVWTIAELLSLWFLFARWAMCGWFCLPRSGRFAPSRLKSSLEYLKENYCWGDFDFVLPPNREITTAGFRLSTCRVADCFPVWWLIDLGGNAEALFFKSIGPWLGSKDLLSTAMVWRSQGSERGTQHRFVYAFEWWTLTILMTRSQYLAFILPSNPNAFALVSTRAGVEAHRAALYSSLNQWVTGRTSCFDLRLNLVTWLYQALTLF